MPKGNGINPYFSISLVIGMPQWLIVKRALIDSSVLLVPNMYLSNPSTMSKV